MDMNMRELDLNCASPSNSTWPSTNSTWPVMKPLSGEARNSTGPATSSGLASRRSGVAAISASRNEARVAALPRWDAPARRDAVDAHALRPEFGGQLAG
jgi:hypothetical protein